MYMADFPILKWMQVDGRSVPFTYPQHQKGNGYVVTGEDNPLPTGNHVLTESGIWVPQRGTEEGAAHTQLTGSMVAYLNITNEVGLISAGTVFRYTIPSEYDGNYKFVSVWFRRETGTLEEINLHHWAEIADRLPGAT